MARDRTIPVDFWTREAVIDCQPMTRLLFIGLWNFADDHGVQPLKPRTIRLQVFPGDAIDNDAVRAMLDELAAQGLVRIYEVDGVEYLAVTDWEQSQRVGRNARRRYPADRTREETPAVVADVPRSSPVSEAPPELSPGPSTAPDQRGVTGGRATESATGAAAAAHPRPPKGWVHAPET